MATTDAVRAVCDAMVHILNTTMNAEREDLGFDNGINPTFAVYTGEDFTDQNGQNHVSTGASVFLYRVLPNLSHRTPAGRVLTNGQRQRHQLPLDLHLIVTIWASSADTQNRLVGWVLRTLEDYPSIPASVLNIGQPERVFRDDESVELVIGEMAGDELLQLWDMLGNGDLHYQISIPYIVRNLLIESHRTDAPAADVQIRTLDMNRLDSSRP
ncbi:MAG TPA: DUF4255 domain-containing protein [Spirillospora sp.]|nr:DUF4255 domain-containing protein [Spirillospora sp.]